jgi:hypothetical protein
LAQKLSVLAAAERANVVIAADTQQHLSMLKILYAACATAVDAFRAADNPVDEELIADLERMVERTRREIDRLAALLRSSSY